MEVEPNMVFDNVNVNRSLASTVISLALLARKGWQELNIFNFAEKRLSFNRNFPEDPDCWLITIILKITFFKSWITRRCWHLLHDRRLISQMISWKRHLSRRSITPMRSGPELGVEDCVYERVDGGGDVSQPKGHVANPRSLPSWERYNRQIWFFLFSYFSLTLLTFDCKTDHIPLEQNMVLKRLLLIFEVKKTSRAKPT